MTAGLLGHLGLVAVLLTFGVYALAVLERTGERWAAGGTRGGRSAGALLLEPLRQAALRSGQQASATERPDAPAARLAPALYLGLAVAGLALAPGSAPVDPAAGIVFWGALEALSIVAVFLHGWSANAPLPLLGAYRHATLGLSALLISMFVLIAAALPAESLRIGAIVEAQREGWNLLRQPLGLPLFLAVGTALAVSGPLAFADSADLAGGTSAERSGPPRLVFALGRRAMLVAFAAMGASCFLGGRHGPALLPGAVWLGAKTLALLALLGLLLPRLARPGAERAVRATWTLLLPLGFAHLAWAGLEALR